MLRCIFIVEWLVFKRWSESILVSRLNACSTDELDPELAIISLARRQRLGYSLFLYWKIFSNRSTALWPQKRNVLIPAQTNFTVILTLECFGRKSWHFGNMFIMIKMFRFSTGKIFCKENVVLLGKVSLVKRQPKMVCGVRWSASLRRVKRRARAIARLSLTGLITSYWN